LHADGGGALEPAGLADRLADVEVARLFTS
jgi:hypothetical protein